VFSSWKSSSEKLYPPLVNAAVWRGMSTDYQVTEVGLRGLGGLKLSYSKIVYGSSGIRLRILLAESNLEVKFKAGSKLCFFSSYNGLSLD